MNTDFFSGVFAAFACIGLGALIALAWRGTRPEPPPRDPWKEMDSYGPVPPDEFSVEEWERTGEQVRETSCGNRDCTNPAHYEGVWDVMRKVGEASITPTRP